MGAGTIIATAIAITLLIITGYVLIGGTLSTARVVALAQQAAADRETQRLHTRIEILNASVNATDSLAFVELRNTGSTVLGDFDHMEVYLLQDLTPFTYSNLSGEWTVTISPDAVHPRLLDPDEVANISVSYDQARGEPAWVKVTTANGEYASAYMDI